MEHPEASIKVGWAFDGLPTMVPMVTRILVTHSNVALPVFLKSNRNSHWIPGSYTGHFVEDYPANTALAGTNGYVTNAYNLRYGYTVDSQSTKIWHYIANDNFPFVIGGVVNESST